MSLSIKNDLGSISVSDDVIASIAGMSAIECYGIVGMAAKRASDGLFEMIGRENLRRGIVVTTEGDAIVIGLYVIMQFGVSIHAVSESLRDTVKYAVENLVGARVKAINIFVQGIRVAQDE